MRILHVVPTHWPAVRYGGPIVSLRALAAAQARAGHEVVVATTSVDGPVDRRELESGPSELDGTRVHYFRCGWPRRLYRAPALGRWLDAELRAFDVVHAHAAFLWPAWRAVRRAARDRVPVVFSPKGMLMPTLIRTRNAWAKRAWIAVVDRRTMHAAQVVHASSAVEADGIAALGLRARASIDVVPNGVCLPDLPRDAPRDPGRLVFVGRLSPEKRIDLLLHAIADVPTARLEILGEGELAYTAALRTIAATLGLSDRVVWHGLVGASTRDAVLARAQALVLCSAGESFGNVVLEALAAGCPVVATRGVGAADVLEEGGGWVEEATAPALAARLAAVIADPATAAAAGRRGRELVSAGYGWDRIAERMERLYLAARRRRKGEHD